MVQKVASTRWRSSEELRKWIGSKIKDRKRLEFGGGMKMFHEVELKHPSWLKGPNGSVATAGSFASVVGRVADELGVARTRQMNGSAKKKSVTDPIPTMVSALTDAIHDRVRILVERKQHNTLATVYEILRDETNK